VKVDSRVLTIDYYSDVLCIWAWIAQLRIDELTANLGAQVDLKFHYVDVFGNVPHKMETQWADKGGLQGFALHILHASETYPELEVNPNIWSRVTPVTSANAHLILKAVELACDATEAAKMALSFRQAFFGRAQDISNLDVLISILREQGLDSKVIQREITNGRAIAALTNDYSQAKALGIKGSPSYMMDGGRQTLYGNVGYRVLHANAEELLKQPNHEASWC